MRRAIKTALIILTLATFFASAYLVLRPWLLRSASQKQAQSAVEAFFSEYYPDQNHVPETAAPSTPTESEEVPERPYAELYAAMQDYNRQIFSEKQCNLRDPWSYTVPALDLTEYGLDADTPIAVLQIPSIGVELPVYSGASTKNLSKGAVLLSQTSFPIGGENTNAVLGAHRGWGGEDYLRNIEKVQIGDEVLVTNLWETLRYTVVEIKIIEPDEISQILIQPGRDLLTVFTCHPYGSSGRYRYLLICERAEINNAILTEKSPNYQSNLTGEPYEIA